MNNDREYDEVIAQARAAKAAAPRFAQLSTGLKNAVLHRAADALLGASEEILVANERDVAACPPGPLVDRLSLSSDRIAAMAAGLRKVAGLPDPVGQVVRGHTLDNGIRLRQVRVPLGVMGMVYEARPNVTVDAFGLALKSGNVALLRGSRSARHSNAALVGVLQGVLAECDLPREGVQLLPSRSHDSVQHLITARGLVDVVIPRGSERLIRAVVEGASVPTIETGTGNCHFYIDASANLQKAIDMVCNGKTRRVSVCNSTECVLIDGALPPADRRRILLALQEAGVRIHGEAELDVPGVIATVEDEWSEEYLSMDIRAKIVDGVEGAIAHIARYSSGHTEGIAAQDADVALRFASAVDSAAVAINASTAFTDGEVFGMGAEIGISTQKLHARGPMGLAELTSSKWILVGSGQTRN